MGDEVRDYYDSFGKREWTRLTHSADGALELAVTQWTIERYMPRAARVLDIGGGPGRYTLWLAERGHCVSLARDKVAASPVGTLVDDIAVVDARDLSRWADGSFDAILALGPFYHLPDPADRDRAAGELARVLRPGGFAFVALMPRYAFLRRTLAIPDERHHLTSPDFVARILDDGVFENDIPGRFTGGYGVRPAEVEPFFARHGLAMKALLAAQSIVPDLQEALAALALSDPDTHRATMGTLVRLADDPSILGTANHLLYVGQKI